MDAVGKAKRRAVLALGALMRSSFKRRGSVCTTEKALQKAGSMDCLQPGAAFFAASARKDKGVPDRNAKKIEKILGFLLTISPK